MQWIADFLLESSICACHLLHHGFGEQTRQYCCKVCCPVGGFSPRPGGAGRCFSVRAFFYVNGNSFIRTAAFLERLPFLWQVFVFTEQSFVIFSELLSSFGLALAAVLVLSLLVLGNVGVVLLVCLTVVSDWACQGSAVARRRGLG